MTDPVPSIATAATTAAEEDAEIVAHIARHRERAAQLRRRLAVEPINALGRRKLRADLAEAEAAIEDGEDARVALRPRLDAERAEASYQRQCAQHAAARQDAEIIAEQLQRFGEVARWQARAVATIASNIERLRARGELPPEMILPDGKRLAEHIVGCLVSEGVLDADMPFHLQTQGGYVIEGVGRTAARSTDQLLATDMQDAAQTLRLALLAHTPLSPDEVARRDALAAERRAAEAAALEQPLPPKGPAPKPWDHRAAR